jgi:hypothetical protein
MSCISQRRSEYVLALRGQRKLVIATESGWPMRSTFYNSDKWTPMGPTGHQNGPSFIPALDLGRSPGYIPAAFPSKP